jgi:hypothetical protein
MKTYTIAGVAFNGHETIATDPNRPASFAAKSAASGGRQ